MRRSIWASEAEELRWLYAVEECRPHGVGLGFEAMAQHLERICKKAGAKLDGPPAKEMPEGVRLPYKDSEPKVEQALAESQK